MNCKKFTQRIPLFVEADLEDAVMQQLSAHFAACESCCKTAKEFQASQFMLHNFAAPEFDEALFAQVRSSVLNELARPKNTVSIYPIWNWKAAFVASSATIILICGIAINHHGQSENHMAQASNLGEVKATNFNSSSSINSANSSPAVKQIPKPRSGRNAIAPGVASVSKRNPGHVNQNHPSPERATEIDDQIEATSIVTPVANDPSATLLPTENITTANSKKPAPEPEMLRMEIQTADPNIKIIWLAPKDSNSLRTAAGAK